MSFEANAAASGRLLLDNDFRLLRVSVRDPAERIVDAASDPMLTAPADRIDRARLALTSPRARLSAEIGWLAGVAPARATQLVNTLEEGKLDAATLTGLPCVPRANLLFANLEVAQPLGVQDAFKLLIGAISAADAIDPAELLRDINEDRSVSRIPPVRSEAALREALNEHYGAFVEALVRFLNRMPTAAMIACVTEVVEAALDNGSAASSSVLERLLAAYEAQALSFLEPESQSIRTLAEGVLANASKGQAHLAPALQQLGNMLLGWDEVAQPLQLIRQAHGDGHQMSRDLAQDIRKAVIQLNNEHGLHEAATEITLVLSQAFRELAELRDTFEEDQAALEDIRAEAAERERAVAEQAYSAKIGVAQTVLSIDSREISWHGQRYPVGEIERVRWGGTSHSVNGIPTGTTYLIAFGTASRTVEVNTRSKEVFAAFTARLWRICGVPIALRMLAELREGGHVRVGDIEFTDDQVTLTKTRFLSKPETKTFNWRDVQTWSASGDFNIAAKAEKGFSAKASYQKDANTHVLANLTQSAFDRGIVRLSEVLD